MSPWRRSAVTLAPPVFVSIADLDTKAPEKRDRARTLISEALEKGNGAISWQVAQEFLNVALHKFHKPLTAGEASDYLAQVLQPLWKVFPSPDLCQDALLIQRQTQYRFYDSLVIASATHAGAAILYSEDLQSGRTFGKTQIVNPF